MTVKIPETQPKTYVIYKQNGLWWIETKNGNKVEKYHRTSQTKAVNSVRYRHPGTTRLVIVIEEVKDNGK